ncbi:deoxynucleoside kinase [Winogradskyella damuponensis]|uniref:Deoxynucleoside kinase n=1 Tax=Winogradskyella damuponensis TaxID=943939 RepID=A0ABP8CP07_9FLAO
MQIYIEGLPGIGKTELAKRIHSELGMENIYLENIEVESIKNLQKQTDDEYALESQLIFLNSKLKQQSIVKDNSVLDYELLLKTKTFASHFLNKSQQELISDFLSYSNYQPNKKSIYIFLKAENLIVLERIKKRGRKYERNYSIDFLESLENYYNEHIKCSQNNWQIINYNDFEIGFKDVKKIINEYYGQNN